MDWPDAPDMLRPASARAALFMVPAVDPRVPVPVGENEPLEPVPAIADAELPACAEPVPWLELWLGPFRAVPREPVAAWAMDWPDAPDMLRPDSARAPLLITPEVEACVPVPDGENDPLEPVPAIADAELPACADPAAWPEVWLGLFRAVPRVPVAAWAKDWPDAPDMLRPASARAALLITPEVEARVLVLDGENEPLAPVPDIADAELPACAEPVPWPEVWLGLFRAVPREPVAAWAKDWLDAPDMLRPDSARAALLRTVVELARVADA
jgi:hypothetical protein